MKQQYHQLLKPEIINTVSGLALISRIVVDGYLSGNNHSRRVGQGMEFSQYRGYEQGHELRLLDSKMLARSGRYYIKQSEIETNISIKFIIDGSKSMLHRESGLSKIEYAKVIVASLAYLAQGQGDAIGLFSLNEHHLTSLLPKIQNQHFNRLLLHLTEIDAEGKWPMNATNLEKFQDRSHRELLFFITDMYEHQDELTRFIKKLKNSRNEVHVLQIMGDDELNFNYKGTLTFEDLETGAQVKLDPEIARREYDVLLNQKLSETREFLLANDIGYSLFKLDDPIEETLQLFLKKRNRLF